MHDYFDILGVAQNAPVGEIRRACARRAWRTHPDFGGDGWRTGWAGARLSRAPVDDVAIDFVDMGEVVPRMQRGFFT